MQTLAADEICKSYRGRRVVNGVSVSVQQGEVVGLLGPNGAGKTTSFYMMVGLIPPDTGRILVDEEEITDVPMYKRARHFGISYLPQEASVFHHVEAGGLPCTIRSKQTNNFALLNADADPVYNSAAAIGFTNLVGGQRLHLTYHSGLCNGR